MIPETLRSTHRDSPNSSPGDPRRPSTPEMIPHPDCPPSPHSTSTSRVVELGRAPLPPASTQQEAHPHADCGSAHGMRLNGERNMTNLVLGEKWTS